MDSLSQIVLGAAVGEAVLGKKVGNKAPLWGAAFGTLPDLDSFISLFTSPLDYLIIHRGFSHSFLFAILMAPLFGYLLHRVYSRRNVEGSRKEWSLLVFWALLTHSLLDGFTSWGTQLLWPFTDYRAAISSIHVIDPFYTLPFLVCVLITLFLHRDSRARKFWNRLGLYLSTAYLCFTLLNKLTVNAVFKQALHKRGSSVLRMETYPTPLNNALWHVVAKEPDGYRLGIYSLLRENYHVDFVFIPHNHKLIKGHEEDRAIKALRWFSDESFSITQKGDTLVWNDLRFGILDGWQEGREIETNFKLNLIKEGEEYTGIRSLIFPVEKITQERWDAFWRLVRGEPVQ